MTTNPFTLGQTVTTNIGIVGRFSPDSRATIVQVDGDMLMIRFTSGNAIPILWSNCSPVHEQ